MDFTDLNKACPKDSYPLSNINHLVDNVLGFKMLSFGDTFIGYDQLKKHSNDEDKMAFITNEKVYCYKIMLFELKNIRATYQRMMSKVFVEQIRRNMEVYMDDILMNSKNPQQYWQNLKKTFKTL